MKQTKKKIILFWILLIVIILFIYAAVWTVRRIRLSKRADDIVGTYLVAGGESYITIEKNLLGRPVIGEGKLLDHMLLNDASLMTQTKLSADIKFSNKNLLITQDHIIKESISNSQDLIADSDCQLILQLVPSEKNPGDWNIRDAENTILVNSRIVYLFHKNSDILEKIKKPSNIPKIIGTIFTNETAFNWKLPKDKSPVKSYLHQVNQPGILPVLRHLAEGKYTAADLESVRQVSKDIPGDPWIGLLLAELEARHGNIEEAESLLTKWMSRPEVRNEYFLKETANRVKKVVHNSKIHEIYGVPVLDTKSEFIKLGKIFDYRYFDNKFHIYYFDFFPFMYPSKMKQPQKIPNYLEEQVLAKVNMVKSILNLFHGKKHESLEVLRVIHAHGSSLNSSNGLIGKLIGMAVRSFAIEGMKIYALNACWIDSEQKDFMELLNQIHTIMQENYRDKIWFYTYSSLINIEISKCTGRLLPNFHEATIRNNVTDIKFQNLRVGASAKFHLLQTGEFPSKDEDFRAYLNDGIPEDLFNKTKPLKYFMKDNDTFAVYSYGPDHKDDLASIVYDPTNGTFSNGDIFLDVPRRREFPFPEEGISIKADNALELLEQFPNGLPRDPFSDFRKRPLSILESDEENPVMIFSWGPDTDEAESGIGSYDRDPLTSNPPNPVATPPPPPDAPYSRKIQRVFLRTNEESPEPGYWNLDPPYDPTNGTITNGDIFIEIPRVKELP